MARRLAPLTLEVVGDLPPACRRCVFWELDPVAGRRAEEAGGAGVDKEAWLSAVLMDWGSCGRIAYVDDQTAGFLMYAPPHLVPRSMAFPTAPVSADAVVLMGGTVLATHRGAGIGRMLVQGAAKDLTRRGMRAIEAYGLVGQVGDDEAPAGCVVPADFLTAVGFAVVRDHHRYPRLRLDLRTALSWREDVEAALEAILGSVRQPVLTR